MARKTKRELISQREYARRCGLSPSTVNEAIKRGRITLVEGKIDPVLADREWAENTDPSTPRNRITGNPKHRRPRGQPSQPMDLGGRYGGSEGDGSADGYLKARAAREIYQAQLAKLQLDRERSQLVRTDEVKIAAFNMARMARDQLLALPARVAATIAATEDAAEIHKILDEEIEKICWELSNGEG
jgi:hypothetical protein